MEIEIEATMNIDNNNIYFNDITSWELKTFKKMENSFEECLEIKEGQSISITHNEDKIKSFIKNWKKYLRIKAIVMEE